MVLRVEFEHFHDTAKRMLPNAAAYVSAAGAASVVSAADPKSQTLLVSHAQLSQAETEAKLRELGMEVFSGSWSLDAAGFTEGSGACFVAAVAYASEEQKPGLWIDAYAEKPELADVMRAMFDEFKANGEVPEETSLEEFIRLANPNVVILSPEQLGNYMEAKADC